MNEHEETRRLLTDLRDASREIAAQLREGKRGKRELAQPGHTANPRAPLLRASGDDIIMYMHWPCPRVASRGCAFDGSRLAVPNSPRCENINMIISISNPGAKLATGWDGHAGAQQANLQTYLQTHLQAHLQTCLQTYWQTSQTSCVKASRARRKTLQIFKLRRVTVPGATGPGLKSLVPGLIPGLGRSWDLRPPAPRAANAIRGASRLHGAG